MAHRVSILLPDLRGGGAERLHVHLANDWVQRGLQVEFALMRNEGELLATLDDRITVHDLRAPRVRSLLLPLVRYLRAVRPAAVIAAMWPLTSIAVAAWNMAGRPGRLFVSDHSQLSISAVREMGIPAWLIGNAIRFTYPLASGAIAVSQGVKEDLRALGRLAPSVVRVIYNPTALGVPFERGDPDARRELWGEASRRHVLSVGTLKPQKDHATLIRAIALLPPDLDVQLTILGEGPLRKELEGLVRELALEHKVRLPGFVLDPYPWYRTADLFVLSSRWEGFGNVLVEALECGVPVVSTDCASGPSEILAGGRYGRLVPIQDPPAMAAAIAASLAETHDASLLRSRAQDFSVSAISDQYLDYLCLKP
jgi:glycosyltransferase involved in cell wall biosynthesis